MVVRKTRGERRVKVGYTGNGWYDEVFDYWSCSWRRELCIINASF
jgi:hypothetical protein